MVADRFAVRDQTTGRIITTVSDELTAHARAQAAEKAAGVGVTPHLAAAVAAFNDFAPIDPDGLAVLARRAWERRAPAEARPPNPAPAGGLGVRDLLAARGQVHGAFADGARYAQALKRTMRSCRNWPRLSDVQVQALDAIQDKIARILAGDPEWIDHWEDVAGYAGLAAEDILAAKRRNGG